MTCETLNWPFSSFKTKVRSLFLPSGSCPSSNRKYIYNGIVWPEETDSAVLDDRTDRVEAEKQRVPDRTPVHRESWGM